MSVQMLINLTVGDVGQKEAANWVCVQYLSVPHPPDAVMVSSHLHSTEILMDLIKGRLKKKKKRITMIKSCRSVGANAHLC